MQEFIDPDMINTMGMVKNWFTENAKTIIGAGVGLVTIACVAKREFNRAITDNPEGLTAQEKKRITPRNKQQTLEA